MLPHQGAGVGQAFEDGIILATALAHASVTRANLPTALSIYDAVRRPFSQGVQRRSDWNGMTYQLRRAGSGWEGVSEEESRAGRYARERLDAIAEEVRAQMRWQFETTVEDDRARLAEMLQGLVA